MDGGACWATVHGVAKNWTQLRDLDTKLIYKLCCSPEYRTSFSGTRVPCGDPLCVQRGSLAWSSLSPWWLGRRLQHPQHL